jgi:hypothetical protein
VCYIVTFNNVPVDALFHEVCFLLFLFFVVLLVVEIR